MLAGTKPLAYVGRMTKTFRLPVRSTTRTLGGQTITVARGPTVAITPPIGVGIPRGTHTVTAPRVVPVIANPAVWARRVRERTGLSQAAFADRICVPVATIRNWEQGRRPPSGAARALLLALDRDPKGVLRALGTAPKA